MTFRTPCRTEDCSGRILPTTAEETGGLCMPCFKKQKRREQEKYIQENQKVVNLYLSLKNPVDIIKVFHESRPHDPLLYYEPYKGQISDCYKSLDNKQMNELVVHAAKLYKEKEEDQAKILASCLLVFTCADITALLEEMIRAKDYYPHFLFKGCTGNIRKQLLEELLQCNPPEDDLFKTIAWLTENNPNLNDPTHKDMEKALSKCKKPSFVIKRGIQAPRKEGFKKSILGNINIRKSGEAWPMSNGIALNPVIQLAISDLPYTPKEFDGIKYICVYVHPDDPAALLEKHDALVIRTYTNEDLTFIDAPESINQECAPLILEFEKMNDYSSDCEYSCDYAYPNVEDYILYSNMQQYPSDDRIQYDWKVDFPHNSEAKQWINECKILGWPKWIQWPEHWEDSVFILQIDSYGLWEFGESSTLYIFKNTITKEFWGTLQIA